MSNPKRAGEQADQLIQEQNRLRAEAEQAAAQAVENRPEQVDAIPATEEGSTHPDVGVQAVEAPAPDDREMVTLKEQLRAADSRWNVLQGMVNKKDSEIEQLRALLAQLSEKVSNQAQSQPDTRTSDITDDETEEFGVETINLITKISTRVATEVFTRLSAKLESRMDEIRSTVGEVGEVSAKTAGDMFKDSLAKRVPNWEAVNVDPAFIAWLDVVDEFAGVKRIDLLTDAYNRMNLARTAKFFEKFIEETTPAQPATKQGASEELLKLVTPGKSRSVSPVVAAQEARVWSAQDIQKLYSDHRTGKITAEEFNKLERDLFKAQAENRLAA